MIPVMLSAVTSWFCIMPDETMQRSSSPAPNQKIRPKLIMCTTSINPGKNVLSLPVLKHSIAILKKVPINTLCGG